MCRARIRDERGDVDRLTARGEWTETLEPFLEEDSRTVKVAATPVVEADPDLKNAVVQMPHRRGRVSPQDLERFMLLEELPGVELLDPAQERFGRRFGAAGTRGLVGCARRLPFRRTS